MYAERGGSAHRAASGSLRLEDGLGKDAERAVELTAIDRDWDYPWPLD
ncbi:hypothetical protein [Streptomyces flavidovirens]|uniref:Oxidoreductase n=1 Tax=Streptomyces flavidovirens TaxID=67298 RepID=A0ABW6RIH8_9ACTN